MTIRPDPNDPRGRPAQNRGIASKTVNDMAEGRSAILNSNILIINYFLSLLIFTPHFAPQ